MISSVSTLSVQKTRNAGFREGVLQVGLDVSTPELQRELDMEWGQLFEDRRLLRTFIFTTPPSKMCLPVNLQRIVSSKMPGNFSH